MYTTFMNATPVYKINIQTEFNNYLEAFSYFSKDNAEEKKILLKREGQFKDERLIKVEIQKGFYGQF